VLAGNSLFASDRMVRGRGKDAPSSRFRSTTSTVVLRQVDRLRIDDQPKRPVPAIRTAALERGVVVEGWTIATNSSVGLRTVVTTATTAEEPGRTSERSDSDFGADADCGSTNGHPHDVLPATVT
jgi:hypothetical protein